MAAYNLFPKEVPANTWTTEGGTAIECVGKETVDPAEPSLLKKLRSTVDKQRFEANLTIPGALTTDLAGGGKITAATIHIFLKASTAGKSLKYGTVATPATSTEPEVTTTGAWYTLVLSKAQAEELTKAHLEELKLFGEHLTTKGLNCYEIYLSVETTAGGGGSSFTREAEEPLSVAETTSRILKAPRATSDTLTLTETTTSQKGVSRSTSDTLTVTEGTTRIATFPRSSSEVGVFEETPTTVTGYPRKTSDTLTVTEGTATKHGVGRQASDPVSLAESTVRLAHTARSGTDTLTVTDTPATAFTPAETTTTACRMKLASYPAVAMRLETR